jgi:hypothetical protein
VLFFGVALQCMNRVMLLFFCLSWSIFAGRPTTRRIYRNLYNARDSRTEGATNH